MILLIDNYDSLPNLYQYFCELGRMCWLSATMR